MLRVYDIRAEVLHLHVKPMGEVEIMDADLLSVLASNPSPSRWRGCTFICLPDFWRHLNSSRTLVNVFYRLLTISRHWDWGFLFITTDRDQIESRRITDYIDKQRVWKRYTRVCEWALPDTSVVSDAR
jgi:hypothetical protein